MSIVVLNGANLGRLGTREPEKYGTTTYADLVARIEAVAAELGQDVTVRQTDSEAELLGWVHQAADDGSAVVINPAGWTHTSVVLRDALAQVPAPVVEVHITNVHAREDFRHHSYVSPVATGVVAGLGTFGYEAALRFLASLDADRGAR
ncbi:type II 3-dehydroquinate dehydratase [Klenkia brasiliensis]|uniref:3-dehydroquinate dehydratase n=1 Tax=Klenkia brasiliensis TaxID=333142 RepID=A0A1G7VLF9_9ACTN|nr:type II 3-dehydroquinate dehydratase [Klenkia brasiliensis]SDG60431.1 3-dehydroquinate dehydratase [Klenkia brasiliensis]